MIFNALSLFSIALTFAAFATNVCAGEMEFKSIGNGGNCNQCGWTMAQGQISATSASTFERLVSAGEISSNYVRINSDGGDLAGALELGRLFRKYQTTVEVGASTKRGDVWYDDVPGECLSACAYAFLGGRFRDIPEKSKLGFHQFFDQDIVSNLTEAAFTGAERLRDQYVVGVLINYLIEMQISTELYPLVAATPPGEMRVLQKTEAIAFKVNNIDDPVSSWKLLPFGNGLISEIESSVSGRKVRLYCAGKKKHLTSVYKNENPGREAQWKPQDVLYEFPELFVTDGKQRWPIKFNQFNYDKPKENLIFVFDIPAEAADGIAISSEMKIGTELPVARVYSGFFGDLEVNPLRVTAVFRELHCETASS